MTQNEDISTLLDQILPLLTEFGTTNPSIERLVHAVRLLDTALANEQYEHIDTLLAKLVPANLPPVAMIYLLRVPFAYKDHLKHWYTFRDKVVKELTLRGKNVDSLLIGLV